jgi:hypothetical protein
METMFSASATYRRAVDPAVTDLCVRLEALLKDPPASPKAPQKPPNVQACLELVNAADTTADARAAVANIMVGRLSEVISDVANDPRTLRELAVTADSALSQAATEKLAVMQKFHDLLLLLADMIGPATVGAACNDLDVLLLVALMAQGCLPRRVVLSRVTLWNTKEVMDDLLYQAKKRYYAYIDSRNAIERYGDVYKCRPKTKP